MPRAPWHVSQGTPLPNRQAFQIGWRSGERLVPDQIAEAVGHGLSADDVVRIWNEFGYAPPWPIPSEYMLVKVPLNDRQRLAAEAKARGVKVVDVALASKHRTKLAAEARLRGIVLPDLCSQVLSTMARDQLFAAILEG